MLASEGGTHQSLVMKTLRERAYNPKSLRAVLHAAITSSVSLQLYSNEYEALLPTAAVNEAVMEL